MVNKFPAGNGRPCPACQGSGTAELHPNPAGDNVPPLSARRARGQPSPPPLPLFGWRISADTSAACALCGGEGIIALPVEEILTALGGRSRPATGALLSLYFGADGGARTLLGGDLGPAPRLPFAERENDDQPDDRRKQD